MAAHLRTLHARLSSSLSKNIFLKAAVPTVTHAATLVAVNSPFPLPPRRLPTTFKPGIVKEIFDLPLFLRFDENSRIIVVEGNMASMKHEFARKIAKEFDMLYVPDVDFDKIYTVEAGFDLTSFNESFGENVYFNLENFLMNPNLRNERFYYEAQKQMLRCRFKNYMKALEHMFSTGQGVVIVRSPHTDNLVPTVLREMNLMPKIAYDEYMRYYKRVVAQTWRPHMIIHLDASADFCLDRIKKRNNPSEVNSEILGRRFLELYDKHFQQSYLMNYRRYSEYLNFDPADLGDWDLIVELLESYDLLSSEFETEVSTKFHDWNKLHKKEWNIYFNFTTNDRLHRRMFKPPQFDYHIQMKSGSQNDLEVDLLDYHGLTPEQSETFDVTKQRRETAL